MLKESGESEDHLLHSSITREVWGFIHIILLGIQHVLLRASLGSNGKLLLLVTSLTCGNNLLENKNKGNVA